MRRAPSTRRRRARRSCSCPQQARPCRRPSCAARCDSLLAASATASCCRSLPLPARAAASSVSACSSSVPACSTSVPARPAPPPKVVRLDPLSADEAIDALEAVGHDFYLYKDATSGTVQVRRAAKPSRGAGGGGAVGGAERGRGGCRHAGRQGSRRLQRQLERGVRVCLTQRCAPRRAAAAACRCCTSARAAATASSYRSRAGRRARGIWGAAAGSMGSVWRACMLSHGCRTCAAWPQRWSLRARCINTSFVVH